MPETEMCPYSVRDHTRLRPCCEHEHPLSPHCWACDGVTDPEQGDAPEEIEEQPHA